MASIRYSYTHYQFNKKFSEPLTIDQYKSVKGNKNQFLKEVETGIRNEFYKNRDRHETSAIFYRVTKGLMIIGGLLGIIYITFSYQLNSSKKEILESVMIVCYIILSISIIGSLSYWRSKRQFKILTNSITRYYSIHADLAFESGDYNKYLGEIENKREYFDTLNRQRTFYENQQL